MMLICLWNSESYKYFQIETNKIQKIWEKRLHETESKQEFLSKGNVNKYFISSNFKQKTFYEGNYVSLISLATVFSLFSSVFLWKI